MFNPPWLGCDSEFAHGVLAHPSVYVGFRLSAFNWPLGLVRSISNANPPMSLDGMALYLASSEVG